ncbi:hypothetical protein Taro_005343 [Colocasia esculenta]|uniref:Uncharacterized protein n=1 Tax=Colocasia esculenta TaxID=4460 RepID=A0A843TUD0_COLES|nr:hypothetical protein [Colocasia esculenta]
MPSAARPEVAQRMATELGLVVLSDRSESSAEEQEEVPAPPGPNEGREEGVARTAESSTRGAEQDTTGDAAETFARRSEGNEETPVVGGGDLSTPREVPEKDVPEETIALATEATPTGEAPAPPKEVAMAPLPPTKMVAVVETSATTLVPTVVGEAARGAKEMALVTEGHEEIADAAAETTGRAEVSNE